MPLVFGTVTLASLLSVGAVENSIPMMAVGGAGLAGLQVWTMMMLQPIRDKISKLETRLAVIESRCQMHYGTQYMHKTPPPFEDTPT